MSTLDRTLIAAKTTALERHLGRIEECLPGNAADLESLADASDAVILHLWQGTQIAIDLALVACLELGGGAPRTYGEAFRRLARAGQIQPELAIRLESATGFPEASMHAFEELDARRVHDLAMQAPADLRAFVAALASLPELAG